MLIEQNMEINLLIKMKINPEVLKFAKVFLILDLCILIYAIVFQNNFWFLNTQVAFISSLFIIIASFISYKRNIENRLANLDLSKTYKNEDKDKIDEIDDPYDLYSEYEEIEIISDEKSKVKRDTLKNTLFSTGGFLSLYRIIGYGLLVFGFFALNNNKTFIPLAFILGLSVVPFGVLISKLKK